MPPDMVMSLQVLPSTPVPMAAPPSPPPLAVTIPPVMVMFPQELSAPYPLPMPELHCPPLAVTVPPDIVIFPQELEVPPPIPAPSLPPLAVTVPSNMVMFPQLILYPPPMAGLQPLLPASREPMPFMVSVLFSGTYIPGYSSYPPLTLFVPSRMSVPSPSRVMPAHLW